MFHSLSKLLPLREKLATDIKFLRSSSTVIRVNFVFVRLATVDEFKSIGLVNRSKSLFFYCSLEKIECRFSLNFYQ